VERIAKFSLKQRIAAYTELGWWRQIAEQEGSGILPVFAMTRGFLETSVTGGTYDERRFSPGDPALRGIELLKRPLFLDSPTSEEEEDIKYRVREIYAEAYGVSVPVLPRTDVRTSIRSEIRRWIAQWDILRYYPDYQPHMTEEAMQFDTKAIPDDAIPPDDSEEKGEKWDE
jgi:hypothetical protein